MCDFVVDVPLAFMCGPTLHRPPVGGAIVPETFHRLKRTVMLLCGVLIVLAFSNGVDDQTLKLTMVEIKLPIELIRWMLWLSAIYYFVGFVTEVQVVRVVNSEAMLGAGMKTVDRAMAKIGRTVSDFDRKMTSAAAYIETSLDSLEVTGIGPDIENFDKVWKEYIGRISNPLIERSRVEEMYHRTLEVEASHARRLEAMDEILTGISARVAEGTAARNELQAYIARTHNELNTLSRRIVGERRVSFWMWEVGGASAAFVFATLFSAPRLIDSLAKYFAPVRATATV